MPGVLRWKLVVAIVVVAIAACSDNPTITTPAAAPTTVPVPTTTAPAPTTTVAPTTTTSTTVPVSTELVGDPAALAALVEQLNADFIGYDGEIPIPDLTNPDPRVAMEEVHRFDFWSSSARTSAAWLPIHLHTEGPDYEESLSAMNNAVANNWAIRNGGDYIFERAEVVGLDHPSIPESVRSILPEGAIAVTFFDALPAFSIVDLDDESTVAEIPAGVVDAEIGVLVPTPTGWKLFYSGDL